jgi:metal-responsive CopG/Arc/MetJ family transcriptional regulator
MKANHYSGVAVRLPTELRAVIEDMAEKRGESLSLIIRDLLREATAARRVGQTDKAAGAPVSATDFR